MAQSLKPHLLPEGTSMVSFVFTGSPWGILACWLLLINLVTFLIFGLDKWKAKRAGARRIPEKSLFLLAIVGGSVGALLGMRIWHHKTLHKSFQFGIPLILFLQILIPAGLFLYWKSFH